MYFQILCLLAGLLISCSGNQVGFSDASTSSSKATDSTSARSGSASSDVSAGNLQVLATSEASHDHDVSVVLGIASIDLHKQGGDFVNISSTEQLIDLAQYQNGVMDSLAQANIEAGTYDAIKVTLSLASVTLDNGDEMSVDFATAADDPQFKEDHPSNVFFLRLEKPLAITSDAVSHLLIKVADLIPPVPEGHMVERFHMMPKAHAIDLDQTGSVSGSVSFTSADSSASNVSIEGVFVAVTSHGRKLGTTRTDSSGKYKITGLPAGTYEVLAHKENYQHSITKDVVVTVAQDISQDIILTKKSE